MIGAGAVGSCLAYQLAGRASVLLLDRSDPAAGLSAHSFGWVNAVDNGSRPYWELTLAALAAHRRLAESGTGEQWFFRQGNLHWADSSDGAAQLSAAAAGYRDKGYPVVECTAAEVRRKLEPGLWLGDAMEPLIWYPEDGHVFAERLLAELRRGAQDRGAEIRFGLTVTGFLGTAGCVRGVRLSSGERIGADAVICCAGRGTNALLGQAGARVPMIEPAQDGRVTGLLIRTTPVPEPVRRVLHAPGLSIRPGADGGLLLHCHDLDGASADGAVRTVLARLRAVLPAATTVAAAEVYFGVRPIPRDRLPVLGWLPGIDSLYVVVTHSGVTLAPLLGELVAREVFGSAQPLAAEFRPDRFSR